MNKETLKELVKNILGEESEYKEFFKKALDKAGKSIPDMSDDEKKAFFNKIDATWDAKGEKKTEGNTFGAERAKAIASGDDSFKVDGKSFKVTGVDAEDKENAEKFTNEGIGTIALGVAGGLLLLKVLKFVVKKVLGAIGMNAPLPKEKLHKTTDELFKQVLVTGGKLNMGNFMALRSVIKEMIDKDQITTLSQIIKVIEKASKEEPKNESVNESELPAATLPASIKAKLSMAVDKIKDSKLSYNQKVQVVGQVMDSLGIDKSEFAKMSSKLKGAMDASNEGNTFGAERAKAIAKGDDSFEVDGKAFKVTGVDAEDKENAKKFANESLINEDLSTGLVILLSAASVVGAIKGHIAAVGGVDDFTPIKDLKAWWQERKSDKALKSIINKIKGDEDIVKFMKLTPAQQRGKFRSLIATKLSDTELDYLNKINRSHFQKESVNEEKYTVIDPKGNQMGASDKMQATSIAKKKGGEKEGYFVVSNKNALKARRALEKFKGDFKNPKLKDMMADLFYESVNEATLINLKNNSDAQTIAAKSKLSYEDSWNAITSYLVATMGLPKALALVLKLEKEYDKIFSESKINEATTSSAPGEWVAYLSMTRGKKLLNTFNTARGAKQFLSKNVDKLLGGANVESVGIMSKKQWDEREAKYAVESVNEAKNLQKAKQALIDFNSGKLGEDAMVKAVIKSLGFKFDEYSEEEAGLVLSRLIRKGKIPTDNYVLNNVIDVLEESVNEDIKNRFELAYYKDSLNPNDVIKYMVREPSHEERIEPDKFSDMISHATKVAKSKGMNAVEFFHRGMLIGSIDKKNGYKFEKGKYYKKSPLFVNEGNAFGMAVTKAKKEGLKEFEFNGKMYKVKEGSYEKNEAAKKPVVLSGFALVPEKKK